MTTQHEEEHDRRGGFRETVSDFFRGDREDDRDTARGQYQRGGEVRGDPDLVGDTRRDDWVDDDARGPAGYGGNPARHGGVDPATDPAYDRGAGTTEGPVGGYPHGTSSPTDVPDDMRTVARDDLRDGADARDRAYGDTPDEGLADSRRAGAGSDANRDAVAQADLAATTTSGAGTSTGTATTAPTGAADDHEGRAALVAPDRAESYGSRWDRVKGEFVDEPSRAVADADALVGELLDELQELFRAQRTEIERGLDTDQTSTEDLRLALRRYRSFFDRLLSI